MFKKKPIGK